MWIIFGIYFLQRIHIAAQTFNKEYDTEYSFGRFEKLVELKSNKDLIGTPLSQHIITGYPTDKDFSKLGGDLVHELNLSPIDTITIIEEHGITVGSYDAFIKTNNKIYSLGIDAYDISLDGRRSHLENYYFRSIFTDFPVDQVSIDYSRMIMLNVFFLLELA